MREPRTESRAYLGRVVVILFFIQLFSIMDRLVLSVLGEDVKRDLGLSDSELGFLLGFAFAVFYATIGIPVARVADRRSRRGVAAVSVALWSLATAASGLAQNLWQLAQYKRQRGGCVVCTQPTDKKCSRCSRVKFCSKENVLININWS